MIGTTTRTLLAITLTTLAHGFGTFNVQAKSSEPLGACEREMIRASRQFSVPLEVLYSVAMTESSRKGKLQPFALNIEGKAYFASTAQEAMDVFRSARARGAKLIDLGCMQINHHYHGHKFKSPDEMLIAARNVDYAASFLKELFAREGNWTAAVGRYHAGPSNHPAQKRYVCSVISNMVSTGLGAWTPAAMDFCGKR